MVNLLIATDDCYVDRGRWYNGTVNVTAKGIPCQPWEDNQPHQHDRPPQIFTELMGAENYCRNPGGEEERPWCYTMDKLTRWEFCDIPHCGKSQVSHQLNNFIIAKPKH